MPSAQINRLLTKNKVTVFFHAGQVSELKAAKGLIELLGLRSENFKISGNRGMNAHSIPGPRCFDIKFDFNVQSKMGQNSLVLNHEPYKYFPRQRALKNERSRTRKSMNLSRFRKVIVFSSTDVKEIWVVLHAYKKINRTERPLLIIGLRIPNHRLVHQLNKMGFKAMNRSNAGADKSKLGRFEIVTLNTMGELANFFHAADLALMGHDRNLFEPAAAGVPILYFKEPLNLGHKTKKMLDLFQLAWRKNKIAKRLVDRSGAAVPVDPEKLKDQIIDTLNHPQKMVRGTKTAVFQLRKRVVPLYRLRISKLLISGLSR